MRTGVTGLAYLHSAGGTHWITGLLGYWLAFQCLSTLDGRVSLKIPNSQWIVFLIIFLCQSLKRLLGGTVSLHKPQF